ncbi:hypothetical protein C0J52_24179 [Blattella germanica]|nr:hypothetical protein C0J52_24179 [Blattella germanica]
MSKQYISASVQKPIESFLGQVMPSCSEFFEEKCFWLGQIFNCCSLFELQRTEYGFCYSFNSELSEPEMKKVDTNNGLQNLKPYRTSTAGPWGGLKFSVKLPPDQIPPVILDHFVPGILLFVTSPYSFPKTGMELTTGNSVEVLLSATITKATPQVRTLTLERRKCKYHNEGQELGYPEYRQENCHAECHRDSAFQYCNCTPYFYPNEVNIKSNLFTDIFNYEKPEAANPFFDDDQEGMSCHCPEDCNHMEYTTDLHVISLMNANTEPDDSVTLVVHFSQPTLMQYRTDVVFGWLDLTVSLGGIAGLFLGFSLLSGAELIYYFTFRLFGVWRSEKRVRKINFQRLPTTMNFIKSRPSYNTTEGYRRKRNNIIFPSF